MNNYQTGAMVENKIIQYLKSKGYEATRSAGSKGAFDVIAYNARIVRFIQAKYTSDKLRTYASDAKRIRETPVPKNCTKELWVYLKYSGFYLVHVYTLLPSSIEMPKGVRIILDEYTGKRNKRGTPGGSK